jgi:N-6 DNA Methylase
LLFLKYLDDLEQERALEAELAGKPYEFIINASRALRQELLSSCNLHTILDCPSGTFIGTGVKTVVLFFEKRPLSEVEGGVPFGYFDSARHKSGQAAQPANLAQPAEDWMGNDN